MDKLTPLIKPASLMPKEKALPSGWTLQHLLPINFPNSVLDSGVKDFYLELPCVGIFTHCRKDTGDSATDVQELSLEILCNGRMVSVSVPKAGSNQEMLASLLQKGADFLRNNEIKPALDKRT